MKEKEELAAALKQGNNKNETLALEKIVIKQLPSHEGRILKVNPDYSFVIVDIGAKEHLSAGDILSVYRDNEFIGRLVIEKVQEGYSAASILPRWRNAQIKENDIVREL